MDVFDRPLFQNRAARDRLKDMGNVQGFQAGGYIATGSGNPDFSGGSRAPLNVFADPSGALIPQYRRAPIRPQGLPSLAETQMAADRGMLFSNALFAAAKEKVDMAQQRFEDDPSGENQQLYVDAVAELEAMQNENASTKKEFVPGPIFDVRDRGVLDVEGPEAMMTQMSPEQLDIFNNLGRAAEKPAPDVVAAPVPSGPSGMEQEARRGRPMGPSDMEQDARGRRPLAPEAAAPAAASFGGRSTMEADARDRGPLLSDPTAVAAGLNAEDPEVRDKTIADFMQEFTSAAPKYEGVDKGLLLAQIGFSIAAGESPNAMQNIANGLLAGSDMMLKDKAAKDEFDRQLQLSAMQYGLQEMGKQREASRTGNFFVAAKPVTIGGRKYQPGESVFVSSATIAKDGVPQGLTTEAMADAVARNKAALDKALIEARDAKNISVSEFNSLNEQLNLAAESFESNRALRPLVESSLIRTVDGKVTGASSFFIEMANKAANSVGVDLGSAYEDPEKYQKDMLKVGNRLVQEILRESGRTVSNVDRELVAQMVGQINNVQAQVTTDPDILVGTLQDILNVIDQNERAALEQYRTVTQAAAGLYAPSGAPLELSARATRVFEDTAPIDMEDLFSYDEATGIWKPKVQ